MTHDQLEAMTMSDLVAVMHQGVVQQFGTPAEVYSQPANRFVAGFIGSPPMNFLDGKLDAGRVEVGGRALGLPKLTCGGIIKVVLGVRPQDLEIVPAAGNDTLPGKVSLIELLGSEKLVEIQLGSERLKVQVRADFPVSEQSDVHVRVDPQRLHVFDAETGIAIRAY